MSPSLLNSTLRVVKDLLFINNSLIKSPIMMQLFLRCKVLSELFIANFSTNTLINLKLFPPMFSVDNVLLTDKPSAKFSEPLF